MSTVKTNNVQVGTSGTATNNFTWYQPATPDGTVRLGVGNTGATTADVVTANSSGNVGIGTTSPAAKFAVSNGGAAGFEFSPTGGISSGTYIQSYNRSTSAYVQNTNYALGHTWYASSTRAMDIDSSGNVGIGTSSPARPLVVYGATNSYLALQNSTTGTANTDGLQLIQDAGAGYIWQYESMPLLFGTNNTERARIDSSGNLLVGTTDAGDSTGTGIKFKPNGDGAGWARLNVVTSATTNGQNNGFSFYSTGASAFRFYVGAGGTIYATSTSISAISDGTLKENVRALETGLSEVMALKPRRFDWKNGDAQNVAGFVAQEVEEVLPELVTDYVYNKDEEGNDIIKKSLKMGDILPTLVKAIQEQQATIESLTARIAALETK